MQRNRIDDYRSVNFLPGHQIRLADGALWTVPKLMEWNEGTMLNEFCVGPLDHPGIKNLHTFAAELWASMATQLPDAPPPRSAFDSAVMLLSWNYDCRVSVIHRALSLSAAGDRAGFDLELAWYVTRLSVDFKSVLESVNNAVKSGRFNSESAIEAWRARTGAEVTRG